MKALAVAWVVGIAPTKALVVAWAVAMDTAPTKALVGAWVEVVDTALTKVLDMGGPMATGLMMSLVTEAMTIEGHPLMSTVAMMALATEGTMEATAMEEGRVDRFNHSTIVPTDMSNRPVCRHFMMKGNCRYENNCAFYHPGVNGPPLP
ncbi:hypothetical protein MC885_013278 [Smutsia gigantea]|nr:hypothetical protein MC885_013278 [Smutsia gigantea]